MLGISRIGRFTILVVVIIILPSVYLLYPHPDIPRAPDDTMWEYEAGGVDSPHWRDPVKPDFETEEARGVEEAGLGQSRVDGGAGGNRLVVEDEIIGSDEAVNGGVIMPKLENATAKWVHQLVTKIQPNLHDLLTGRQSRTWSSSMACSASHDNAIPRSKFRPSPSFR